MASTTSTTGRATWRIYMKWALRVVGAIVGLVMVLMLVGAAYQTITTARDASNYPPPGKLIDVGGHRLHLYCTGQGSPTVVMDAMGGASSLAWGLVQPHVATFSRVCSYDRAGLGWSDPGPTPRTAQQFATELHALLIAAEVSGPYVLVGHSLGGFTVRMYASQHPHEVVGMVLVDAGHEDELSHSEFRHYMDVVTQPLPYVRIAAWFGVIRLAGRWGLIPTFGSYAPQLSPEEQARIDAMAYRTQTLTTMRDEAFAVEETTVQVQATGSLGERPLAVLSANGPRWMPWLPPDFPMEQFKTMWLQLQKDLTTLSSNSWQTFADHSSHFIQFDQPELVIDAIRQVVEATRQKQAAGHAEREPEEQHSATAPVESESR